MFATIYSFRDSCTGLPSSVSDFAKSPSTLLGHQGLGHEVADLQPGIHGSTFGGNPLAAAIARTSLKVLVEEGLIENAAAMGERFLAGLKMIENQYIKDVRGRGLMIAVEFQPEAGGAKQYVKALAKKGLLCKETHTDTIRFAPPLVITKDEVDWAVNVIKEVLE